MTDHPSAGSTPKHSKRRKRNDEDSGSSTHEKKNEKETKKEPEEKNELQSQLDKLGTKSPTPCDNEEDIEELGREISAENYQVISLLGVGSQGRVYLVRLTSTDQYFALKVFRKDKVLPNEKTTRSIITEHRFLSSTDHPFVTKLYHSFHSNERLFMVMEFCPGGELFTTIKKQPGGHLNEEQVRFYASEVVLVLEYIHSKGYIYRDLKPENILLHLDGHIRMADFGLSKQSEEGPNNMLLETSTKSWNPFSKKKKSYVLQQGEVLRTVSLVGSVHYLAPEVVSGDSYDVMADWWAFGVLLYDMLYGFPPFKGRTNKEIINRISVCEYRFPDDFSISQTLKSLIKSLLKLDPRKRLGNKLGAAEIKRHPFFSDVHWGLLRNREAPIVPKVSSPCDTSHFEIYAGDEDSVDFNFFSELPDDPEAISEADQAKFKDFHFCRDSFANILTERKAKLESANPKNSGRHKGSIIADGNGSARKNSESDSRKNSDASSRKNSDVDSRKNSDASSRKSSTSDKEKSPLPPKKSSKPQIFDEPPKSPKIDVKPIIDSELSVSKRAKRKPARKKSATHKEDDDIIQ